MVANYSHSNVFLQLPTLRHKEIPVHNPYNKTFSNERFHKISFFYFFFRDSGRGDTACVASVEGGIRLPKVPLYSPQQRKALRGQSVSKKAFIQNRRQQTLPRAQDQCFPFSLSFCFSYTILCPSQNVIYELINTEQTYMDDLSAALEVSSSNYSVSRDLFCKNSCLFVFLQTSYKLRCGKVGAYVWFKYLATKSHVSLSFVVTRVSGWDTCETVVELKVLPLFIIIDLHRGPAIGRMNL